MYYLKFLGQRERTPDAYRLLPLWMAWGNLCTHASGNYEKILPFNKQYGCVVHDENGRNKQEVRKFMV